MAEARQKFDEDFKQGAVRLVRETGKPIAQVARELGINGSTLGYWCAQERRRLAAAKGTTQRRLAIGEMFPHGAATARSSASRAEAGLHRSTASTAR
ncbi:transposase [Kribbella sp. CA-294648]|uniref:transposase n=1 Tax=Kribbella sp. CA-294648 TaxID=3239948 RepID=UPI003D8CD396